MPSQNEYNVAKQNGRIIHTKIFLLNYKLQKVDELSGVVLDGATFNIDATSDIRRTCSISLIPKDSSFDIKFGGKIWLDTCGCYNNEFTMWSLSDSEIHYKKCIFDRLSTKGSGLIEEY